MTAQKPEKNRKFAKGESGNPNGRPKGVPNKVTTEVKEMVLQALGKAGGIDYLTEKAETHPQAFLTLVGKVIPLQVNGAGANGEHMVYAKIERVIVDAAANSDT